MKQGIEDHVLELIKKYDFEYSLNVEGSDCIITIGGDGTILHALDKAIDLNIPVFGIHAGRLGYLASCMPDELDAAFKEIKRAGLTVLNRSTVDCLFKGRTKAAVNEVVLQRAQPHRMSEFDISINNSFFTTYYADAVMVASPTGSTAYSLSAGGPIVSPTVRGLIFTPVAPHILLDRSIVLAEEEVIGITPKVDVNLVIDGTIIEKIEAGESIETRVGQKNAQIVYPFNRCFHDVLKEKFSLGQSARKSQESPDA